MPKQKSLAGHPRWWFGQVVVTLTLIWSPLLSAQTTGDHLRELETLLDDAVAAADIARESGSIDEMIGSAREVFTLIWGKESGISAGPDGAVSVHGWKTRWQVTNSDFDPKFAERYGDADPAIEDSRQLGFLGRARDLRRMLTEIAADSTEEASKRAYADSTLASLNNVIGWHQIDSGVTKAELQPRVDLTHVWDAPKAFWNSTADTGWIQEAYSQCVNMLKTDYGDNLVMATKHTTDLYVLLRKVQNGVDADGDGVTRASMMEGGLNAALAAAKNAGYFE